METERRKRKRMSVLSDCLEGGEEKEKGRREENFLFSV